MLLGPAWLHPGLAQRGSEQGSEEPRKPAEHRGPSICRAGGRRATRHQATQKLPVSKAGRSTQVGTSVPRAAPRCPGLTGCSTRSLGSQTEGTPWVNAGPCALLTQPSRLVGSEEVGVGVEVWPEEVAPGGSGAWNALCHWEPGVGGELRASSSRCRGPSPEQVGRWRGNRAQSRRLQGATLGRSRPAAPRGRCRDAVEWPWRES